MAAKKKTTPAKTTKNEVAEYDYGEHAGGGFEGQTSADMLIPFLNVLQANSPEIDENADAEVGMFINTATDELYDGDVGILGIPAFTEHAWVEWTPRDSGGGFVARHNADSEVVRDYAGFGKVSLPNGNDLVETFYVYYLLVPEEMDEDPEFDYAIVPCWSKKIGPYKEANRKWRKQRDGKGNKIPLYANLTRLKSWTDQNKHGKFRNIAFEPAEGDHASSRLAPNDPRFLAAAELKKLAESGVAQPNEAAARQGEDDGSDESLF